MRNNGFYIKFRGFLFIFIGLFISILVTTKVYYFINPYNNNKIFSQDMLIAIKNYHVSYGAIFKNKIIIRMLEIIAIVLLFLSKYRNKTYDFICLIAGSLCGFYGTILYLEMGYKGIINLLIISFPHMLFYIAAFLCLISLIILKENNTIDSTESKKIFNKVAPYLNILLLWTIGILSEIIINIFLVQKCFII